MSKAFTRESDDLAAQPLPRQASPLPPGAKNYMTTSGASQLRAELDQLVNVDRPSQMNSADGIMSNRELQAIDQRIAYIKQSLQSAVIVAPSNTSDDQVRFGSTVMVQDRAGNRLQYRIVGVDEADFDKGWVSWLSPIARALLKARPGQRVKFRVPSGEEELEILTIE